jgi:predicted dehydrogenase
VAQEFGIPSFENHTELLGQIDAAVIATPTRTHFDIASQLLAQRVHLLIEKPMTDSVATAQQLTSLAERFGCLVQVGHCERFNPAFREALTLVGQPKFVVANRLGGYTFRSTDIGVVHDLMIHDIDLVNAMFPGSLVETRAVGFSVFGGHEDMAQARLHFSCGGVANLSASRCSFQTERSLQIFGTSGFAAVDLANSSVTSVRVPDSIRYRQTSFQGLDPAQQAHIRTNLFESLLPKTEVAVERSNAILDEQRDWLTAIRYGERPTISAEIGAQAVAIAQSILDSLTAHRWSQFDPASTGPLGLVPREPIPTGNTSRRAA